MTEIADKRPASARWGVGEAAVALIGVVWVVAGAVWAVPAYLGPDGLIYAGMLDAFARHGSLFIGNGYEAYGSEALTLSFMSPAEGGLAPQYPGGWGILGAPVYAAWGIRGVIVLNAVASALTLPLIWATARALFEDRDIAVHAALIFGIASFAVDYAFGFSPHAVTTLLTTAALAAAAHGWRGGEWPERRGALVAGLILGLGANIRVDALILAAPIGVWLLGAGRRPYVATAWLAAGLLPGLAAAAAINQAKFGTLSPISYGSGGGATSIQYYAGLAPLAIAGVLAALTLGFERVRAMLYRPRSLLIVAVGLTALLLALPPTREVMLRLGRGFWVLVVDFQAIGVPGRGLALNPDGTISAFGALKKALLQSMPYAAIILILGDRLVRGPSRAGLALCLLVVALTIAPFAYGAWHGGASKNMRYFLNLLPALAILSAAALERTARLAQAHPSPAVARWALTGVVAAALGYGVLRGYDIGYVLEATLANMIVLALALLALVALITRDARRGAAASAMRGVAALGLAVAFHSAWVADLRVTQTQRASNLAVWSAADPLPRDALVVSYTVEFVPFRLNRPPALTAEADVWSLTVSDGLLALIGRAFAEGRPVLAQSRYLAEQLVDLGAASGFAPRFGLSSLHEFHAMQPPTSGEAPR